MAINRATRYPGRFETANSASPQGAFKNRTGPTSEDGSFFEADWANDHDGFFARILNVAGVTPNGTIDTGLSSQLYDALMMATPGRLLGTPKVITSSGTYTKTSGTNLIIVEMVGGGGAGGSPAQNGSGNTSGSGGGNSGAYARFALNVSSITTVACTIGAGGVATAQQRGGGGGATIFGSYCTVPGGLGGLLMPSDNNSNKIYGSCPIGSATVTTSGVTLLNSNNGSPGGDAIILSAGIRAGFGAASTLSGVTYGQGVNYSGLSGSNYGGGGAGCAANNSSFGTNMIGGAGAKGVIIISEYS